jgi:hypothetical protein
MTVALTNLSNRKFDKARFNLNRSARKFGIQKVYSYSFEKDICNTEFFVNNSQILSQERGVGYWLWKPYIILQSLAQLNHDDILIYSDCGIEIINQLDPLISLCAEREPILLFGNRNFINSWYTKRDCFILMNCDFERYWYSLQCDAAFMVFRKSDFTMTFLTEWMEYCLQQHIITDSPNIFGKENLPGFIDHRHDQSVISILAEKYNINLYRMPTAHRNNVFLPVKLPSPRTELVPSRIHRKEYAGLQHTSPDETEDPVLHVQLQGSLEERERYKYSYLLSYLNSRYDKILFHHRRPDIGFVERLKFRIRNRISKFSMSLGYVIERIS